MQRGNAEIGAARQEVIDRCWALGEENPILSIHDVGAGGLSNALPELVARQPAAAGAFDLRAVPNDEPGMSPLEIWCNEAQERYVLADRAGAASTRFAALCERERCPFAVLGVATDGAAAEVATRCSATRPWTCRLDVLLGKPPRMHRDVQRAAPPARAAFDSRGIDARRGASAACCGTRRWRTRRS